MFPESTKTATPEAAQECVISKLIEAPQRLVFEAWTRPRQAAQWYGPEGFTVPVCEMDVRTGGAFLLCQRAPSGAHCWERGVFREVEAPSRIVSVYLTSIDSGPEVALTSEVRFVDLGAQTEVIVRQEFFDSNFTRGARQGLTESLERLAAYMKAR